MTVADRTQEHPTTRGLTDEIAHGVTPLGTPIQGVTLYSFTRFWHGRQMTFEQLVREVAARGLGPGLEIVGFQSIRNFPRVSDEFVTGFRSLIDETGLLPTAMGANADAGLRRDRMLTSHELVEYMTSQIQVASRLGFKIVRVQFSLTPDDMERLLPVAERYDVTLGMEIHAHHSAAHPVMQALLERYDKLDSPRLGFIPDWGATMVKIPRTLLQRYRSRGVAAELVDAIDNYWDSKHGRGGSSDEEQGAQFGEVMDLAQRHGATDLAIELAVNATALFGHGDISGWKDILQWAVHSHAKFYEIDETGHDPSVDIPAIVDIYIRNGYSRTFSSEWEGFHWNDADNAFDMISSQQALIRDSARTSGSEIVTDANAARLVRGWEG